MAVRRNAAFPGSMASPWRRERLCTISGNALAPAQATLHTISGRGARVTTTARPAMGNAVDLRHPEAGTIRGRVMAHAPDGVHVAFDPTARAVAFALAATTADMSRPGPRRRASGTSYPFDD